MESIFFLGRSTPICVEARALAFKPPEPAPEHNRHASHYILYRPACPRSRGVNPVASGVVRDIFRIMPGLLSLYLRFIFGCRLWAGLHQCGGTATEAHRRTHTLSPMTYKLLLCSRPAACTPTATPPRPICLFQCGYQGRRDARGCLPPLSSLSLLVIKNSRRTAHF